MVDRPLARQHPADAEDARETPEIPRDSNRDSAPDARSAEPETPAARPSGEKAADDDLLFDRKIVPGGKAQPLPRVRPLRKASNAPLYVAAILSAFWTGTMFAYAVGYYGPQGLLTLPPLTVAALAAALFGPLAIIWGFALIMWWGGHMRVSAEHVANATRALLTPTSSASDAAATIAQAVSAEMRRMERALKEAEERAFDLRKSVSRELNGLEAASARAEMRARTLRDIVGAERKALGEVGEALEKEAAVVVDATRAQAELVSGVTGRAAEQMGEAQAGITRASEYLSKTLEAVARSARAVRDNVEAQADRLEAAAQSAVERNSEMAEQFSAQGEQWTHEARRFAEENERTVRAFAEQRQTLQNLAEELRERAQQIEKAVGSHAGILDSALDGVEAKAAGLGPRLSREADRLTAAAREAAARIEETSSLFETRTGEMNASVTETTGHLSQSLDFATKNVDASGERLRGLLSEIGGAAQGAASEVKSATDQLGRSLEALPGEAQGQAERLRAIMSEQIGAIAAIAESVADALERMSPGPVAGAWPPPGDPAGDTPAAAPSPAPAADPSRRWRLGEVLSAARARENSAEAGMPRAAHHIIETLQSLSIDIDRTLEEDPPLDLWRRYRAGERRVFTKRLASLRTREPHSKIAERYNADAEFRADVDRYLDQFEKLVENAAARDRDQLLAETYMSSDIGKVYALLAEATGRVA